MQLLRERVSVSQETDVTGVGQGSGFMVSAEPPAITMGLPRRCRAGIVIPFSLRMRTASMKSIS